MPYFFYPCLRLFLYHRLLWLQYKINADVLHSPLPYFSKDNPINPRPVWKSFSSNDAYCTKPLFGGEPASLLDGCVSLQDHQLEWKWTSRKDMFLVAGLLAHKGIQSSLWHRFPHSVEPASNNEMNKNTPICSLKHWKLWKVENI